MTTSDSFDQQKQEKNSFQRQSETDQLYWKIMRQWLLMGVGKKIFKIFVWLFVGGGKWLFMGGGKLFAVVGGFSFIWGLYQHHEQSLQFQQKAVENYIGTVKTLMLDELDESGKVQYKDIQVFIRAQAGTTFRQLSDCPYKNQLISFLRDAKIGFLPRNSNEQLTKADKINITLLRGIDLEEANFNKAKLDKIIFQDAKLSYSQLKRTELADSNLRKAYLEYAKLNGINLKNADLTEANLSKADLSKNYVEDRAFKILFISLPWPNFINPKIAELQHANLRGAKLQSADLREADLTNANLIYADLGDASLSKGEDFRKYTQLNGTVFKYALYIPEQTKFPENYKGKEEGFAQNHCMIPIKEGLNLAEELKKTACSDDVNKEGKVKENALEKITAFSNTDLSRVNLKGAELQNINFSKSNFQDAKLQGANLDGAILDYAILKNVNFDDLKNDQGQVIKNTNIDDKWRLVADIVSNRLDVKSINTRLIELKKKEKNLRKANLQGANLQNVNFQGVDLQGANLDGAILDYANLKNVKLDDIKGEKGETFKTIIDDKWRLVADIVNNRLKNKDLSRKDLSKTNLQGANLQGINFTKADLTNANLKNAKNADLANAKLCNTTLPNGKKENSNCQK